MSDPTYNESIVESINNFRSDPGASQKYFQMLAKVMKRTKHVKDAEELTSFAEYCTTLPSVNALTVSNGLQRTAEDQLLNIIKGTGKLAIMTDIKLKERADYFTESNDGCQSIADHGDLDNLLQRVVLSKLDHNGAFLNALTSENIKFIGVASAYYKDDPTTVIVLATDVVEIQEVDYGEDQDLKDAFDLFDVWNTGKLEEKALKDAFEALGFDKDSYSVYRGIMMMNGNNDVKKNGGVDWPTFKDTIKELVGGFDSKEELRTLFELFVDSPDQEKITADTMKRVAKEIGDKISYKELTDVMKRSSENGVDLDFEEFYKIMQNYKDLHNQE